MRRKENGMFTRVLSILLTSPSTTFRSRRRRMGTREVRTVSEEWKEWRTERTERVPLPTSLRSSRRLLTFPPHPTAARPERNVVKWRGVRDEWREWGTNGRSEEWTTLSAAVGLWGSVRPSRLRLLSPHFTRLPSVTSFRLTTFTVPKGRWSEGTEWERERDVERRPDSDSSSARNACRYVKRPAVDSPLIYRPPTRPISLRMPLTPPIRSLATLSPYPNPPPCIPLATVSQSHSSAVGKGPASSPHSLHCVSVPRYTPPADRDRDRPASSFLSWTAGPSPGAPPPSAPLTPFTRRRLAAGVMRGVRNGPSFFRPITALRRPCRRNRAKEVTAFHSFPPSLRSGVSLPFPLRPYATPFVHFGHSVSSLVMLSPPFGHGAGTGTEPKVEWTERKWGGGKWTEDRH